MLEIQMQDIETKLSQSSDVEEQMSLMKQLQELQELRKEFAIHNGERIVNPRL
jgi:membrane protein insertase Oxa1/YidC/SpoIIIJ